MTKKRQKYLPLLILKLTLLALTQTQPTLTCTVCNQCTNCSNDVLADTYIDTLHAMLLESVDNVGYPTSILRTRNTTAINYQMAYTSGY